uniref:Putative secreted protein n=1 Tax=Rhipicephalus microplus TaxID=6941 RepID=A0A6G5A304_RHIMP
MKLLQILVDKWRSCAWFLLIHSSNCIPYDGEWPTKWNVFSDNNQARVSQCPQHCSVFMSLMGLSLNHG